MIVKSDPTALVTEIRTAFERSAEEVVGLARQNAPVSVSRGLKLNAGGVQGGLRASIHREPTKHDGSGYHTRVGSPLRYAMMREKGGVIVPVRARLLSWINPITGKRVFAKRVVQRPGGPRQGYRPWLGPAGDKWPALMSEHLQAMGR